MSAGKIIGYISAGIFIVFGTLFILATFSESRNAEFGLLFTGLILVGIGFVIIWFTSRKKPSAEADGEGVTLKLDLSGDVNLDQMTCQSCGGAITMENIKMVAGAPVVSCPFCNSTYQLTEEPKW